MISPEFSVVVIYHRYNLWLRVGAVSACNRFA